MKGVKNEVEIQGLKRAHRRDGACYVQFLAWMDEKMSKGFEISEWEAAWRQTEFRRKAKNFMGLAYETISATGLNAASPHYHPLKSDSYIISKDTPYLNDSGGQYRDGTCDTTRTMHYGRPTLEQSEAYTRVLQGHVGGFFKILHAKRVLISRTVDRHRHRRLPKGHDRCPTGCPCAEEFMARRSELSRELIHVFDLFFEISQHFDLIDSMELAMVLDRSSTSMKAPTGSQVTCLLFLVTLLPTSPVIVSQTPCTSYSPLSLYSKTIDKADDFGIRIESVLVVRSVQTKHTDPDESWYGFERITCVPIQTRMVLEHMLTKEEKEWVREHNRRCLHSLEDLLQDDKRALKWLRREAERPIGVAPAGPGGVIIDWGE
jgi:hypothetical protein